MAVTRGILSCLRKYIEAEYATLQGEEVVLGAIANAAGQEIFNREIADRRRKDELLERTLKQVEFSFEDAVEESEIGTGRIISVMEVYKGVVVMAGAESELKGKRKHVFEVVHAGADCWLVSDHQATDGGGDTEAANATKKSAKKTKSKKTKGPGVGFNLGLSVGQLVMFASMAGLFAMIFIPYSNRTEICLETGAKRKSVTVAGINLVNKQIETDLSKWIAQQGATPQSLSWTIFEGREGRAFGQKLRASSRATNAIKILERLRAKGDAGKALLLEYQDIQQRRARGKQLAGLEIAERQRAVKDATAAGKEYRQFLKRLP